MMTIYVFVHLLFNSHIIISFYIILLYNMTNGADCYLRSKKKNIQLIILVKNIDVFSSSEFIAKIINKMINTVYSLQQMHYVAKVYECYGKLIKRKFNERDKRENKHIITVDTLIFYLHSENYSSKFIFILLFCICNTFFTLLLIGINNFCSADKYSSLYMIINTKYIPKNANTLLMNNFHQKYVYNILYHNGSLNQWFHMKFLTNASL